MKECLQSLADKCLREWEVALARYQAEHMKNDLNPRTGIGAGEKASEVVCRCLDAIATKYVNRCKLELQDPRNRANEFAEVGHSLVEAAKRVFDERYSDGPFGSKADHRRLFAESFTGENRLADLIDDVKHGEVGTDVLYQHVGWIRRQWNDWGKPVLLGALGAFIAAEVNHSLDRTWDTKAQAPVAAKPGDTLPK